MAILNKCCCRLSVRKGAFLSSIYTLIYFFTFALLTGNWAYHEGKGVFDNQNNLQNNASTNKNGENEEMFPNSEPPPNNSYGTIFVLLLDFTCEVIGFFATILLIFGLKMEKKNLLLPWIIIVPIHTAIDTYTVIHIMISHTGSLAIVEDGEPHDNHGNSITLFTIILDFIIISINIYVLLCVISQYQEYCDGRGTAAYEETSRQLVGGSVQYTGNPTVSQSGQSGRSSQNLWADELVLDPFNSQPGNHSKKPRKRKESAKGTSVHFDSEPSICDSSSRFLLRPDYRRGEVQRNSDKSSRSSFGIESTSGEILEESPP